MGEVGPHHACEDNDRVQNDRGDLHHLAEQAQAEPPHAEQEQVGDDQAPVDGVDELGVLLEHERAGDHAVDDERADEQRRRHVAGDAEGEERDEAGRDHSTVG